MSQPLDASTLITQATMATTLVKMLVDLVKLCWGGDDGHTPRWVPPVAAVGLGVSVLALLAIAVDQDLTQPRVAAQTVLAGLMAAVSAIGITELHKIARPAGGEPWTAIPPPVYSGSSSAPPSYGGAPVAAGTTDLNQLPSQLKDVPPWQRRL